MADAQPPAHKLGAQLRALFARDDDSRYESGDCEPFAASLVDWAKAHGLAARLLYGYRSRLDAYDGATEDPMPVFSHAVAEITFADGSADRFDYLGENAIERWEANWGTDFRFEHADTGEVVSGFVFEFEWADGRWDCYCFPRFQSCATATARLAVLTVPTGGAPAARVAGAVGCVV